MATFADLCTLLLTFFVLLLTFANMDVQKFKEMLGSVKQAFGVQFEERGEFQAVKPKLQPKNLEKRDKRTTFTAPPPSAQPMRPGEAAEARRMAAQINAAVAAAGMKREVAVTAGSRGVRMRIKGKMLFDPGQAQVKKSAAKLLEAVARVLKKYRFYLTVEGHTDSRPISTPRYPSNWELSAARASAVLRSLVGMGVPEVRVSAVGYASNHPLADNSTPEGREKNRRVEFVLTKRPLRVGVN